MRLDSNDWLQGVVASGCVEKRQGVARGDLGPACQRPIVATASKGRHLAIALPPAPGIQIFTVGAALKEDGKATKLPVGGVPIRHVEFVRSDGRTGLLFTTDQAGQRGSRVFDVARRRLAQAVQAWH